MFLRGLLLVLFYKLFHRFYTGRKSPCHLFISVICNCRTIDQFVGQTPVFDSKIMSPNIANKLEKKSTDLEILWKSLRRNLPGNIPSCSCEKKTETISPLQFFFKYTLGTESTKTTEKQKRK